LTFREQEELTRCCWQGKCVKTPYPATSFWSKIAAAISGTGAITSKFHKISFHQSWNSFEVMAPVPETNIIGPEFRAAAADGAKLT
jgi:hypothetical protein